MKQIYKLFLLFVLSLGSSALIAQSDSCYNATPFCDSVNQYAATTSGISAPSGNDYGCLGSEPNPTFFTLTVSQSGSIDITLLNTANVDIDFILWGPYADAATAQSFCGNLGNGSAANGNIVDTCSYSGASVEYVQISNAVAGSVYILMITNFSQQPTNIYSTSNSGTGSIGCPCNLGYNIDTLPSPINNGFLTDTSVVFGQYVVCPDEQLGVQIGVSGNSTDTLRIYQPLTTLNSVFPGATLFTAAGLNHDTISIGALITPDRSHIGTQQFDIAINSTTPTNTCQEIVTIEVIVPGIDLRDTTICSGDSIRIPIDTFPVTYVGFSQYQWTQIGGTPATISNDTLAQPSISAPPLPIGVPFDSIVLQVDFSYGGCVTTDTVTIIVIGVPDGAFTYPDTLYCQQGVTNPTAVVTGTPGGTFSSNTGVVFSNTSTGEIDLANTPVGNHDIFYELSSPGGQCDARDTFNLDIIGITTFQALSSKYFICDNILDTVQLSLNVVYGGTPPSNPTYAWTPTANLNNPAIQNPLAFLLTPDTFVVSYDDGVCAVQMDTVAISAPYPANITVSPDVTICNGATIQLGATVATSSGNQNFCIPAPTTITVENTTLVTLNVSGIAPSVINSALIASLSTSLGINMNSIGQLTIDLIAPSGEVVNLSNRNGGLNNAFPSSSFSSTGTTAISSIPFFGGIPTASFLPQAGATGFNTLIGATTNGTWTLRIIHNNGGFGLANGTLTDWCLSFQDLSQATFTWSPNYNISCLACDSTFVNPTVDTAYTVIAQNAFGCRDTGVVNITIDSTLPTPIINCGTITTNSVTFNWGLIPGAAGYSVSINGNTPSILGAAVDSIQVTGLLASECAQIVIFALSGTSCLDGAPDSLTCCAIGCTSIDPIIISPNGPTTFCFGQSVTLDAGAGYTGYQWSTAANDTNQTVLVTTTQLVSVTTTDVLGCLDTGSIAITVTPGPVPTITPNGSTTLCAGDTVLLDAGAFTSYAWSPSGNTQIIPATTSAVHVVTVTDAQGCSGFDSIIVNVGAPLLIPITKTDLSCNSAIPGDGTATVTPSGGFLPYNFTWSTGAATATISNLSIGTYIVTVTDNNGCVAIDSITINEPSALIATTTGTPVSCNGSSDGIARAFGAGGTPGYTFLWDANTGNQTTAFATGLLPGNYCVTLTDINGCVDSTCATILQTTQTFSAGPDVTICEGDTTQLTSTLADGYTWTPTGSLSAANVQNPIAFPATTTTYYVSADIVSGVNIIYNGDFEDGDVGFSSAYALGTGGAFGQLSNAGEYAVNTNAANTHNNFASCTDHTSSTGNFMVLNGSTAANQSVWCQTVNVSPNTNYQFSTWVTSVVTTNPANLQFSINGVNIGNPFTASSTTCQWNQFFATWNSGASTTATICINNQNTVNAGNDFGLDDIEFIPICNLLDSVLVTVNPKPTITINNNTPICENDAINLSSTGGLNYNWAGPNTFTSLQQNPSISNALAANGGQYVVTVTTALGCSDTASTNVVVNQHPSVTISNTPVLCFGTSTGTATANALGGGGGYSYTWSNTQTVNPITNLPIGAYQVTVVDVNGCFDSASTLISEPSQVTATIATVAVSCNGGADGTATATVGGGTPGVPAYTY
ncbi:MAG: internalin, putative, partial [uncultured Aureispira sp.]